MIVQCSHVALHICAYTPRHARSHTYTALTHSLTGQVRNGFFEPFTPVVSAAGDIVLFKVWAMLVWLDGRNGNPVIARNCNDTSCIPGGITHHGKGWTRLKQQPSHIRDTYVQNTFSMAADASHVVAACSKGKQVLCFHVNEWLVLHVIIFLCISIDLFLSQKHVKRVDEVIYWLSIPIIILAYLLFALQIPLMC